MTALGVSFLRGTRFFLEQVQKTLQLFPCEQGLFLRSNDLKRDHKGTLDKIADFLGIEAFPGCPPRLDHQTKPVNYPLKVDDVEFLRDVYRDNVAAFAGLTGLDVSDWPTINSKITIRI